MGRPVIRDGKTCSHCGGSGPHYKSDKYTCIECRRVICRESMRRNRDKHLSARRNSRFVRKYGLTTAQREDLFYKAGNRCQICRSAQSLYVDHDHATGKVRGALCQGCNLAIGFLKNDSKLCALAAKYLEVTW